MNLARVLLPTISSTYFWCFYEISSALYSTIIWASLLITGRRFYQDSNWNILSKITIISIIILNIIHWTTTTFTLSSTQEHPDVRVFIFQAIFWLISGVCSFLYAFKPVLKTLSDIKVKFDDIKNIYIKNNNDDSKTNENIYIKNNIENNIENNSEDTSNNNDSLNNNSTNGMIENSITEITIANTNSESINTATFKVYPVTLKNASVEFSLDPSIPFDPISNSIDFILRTFLVLIYGVPPSKLILDFLSKK
ncbi:9489_t:CDS:2, partial [Racocetra persica]